VRPPCRPGRVAAITVDGLHIADHLMVVALAITTAGRTVRVGLIDGDIENTTVVTALLADLVDRGLDTTGVRRALTASSAENAYATHQTGETGRPTMAPCG
jgi:hypothetical protein